MRLCCWLVVVMSCVNILMKESPLLVMNGSGLGTCRSTRRTTADVWADARISSRVSDRSSLHKPASLVMAIKRLLATVILHKHETGSSLACRGDRVPNECCFSLASVLVISLALSSRTRSWSKLGSDYLSVRSLTTTMIKKLAFIRTDGT